MCEFCTEHGEGKKWYLQMKNYSKELLDEELSASRKEAAGAASRYEWANRFWENFVMPAITGVPGLPPDKMFASTTEESKKVEHFGQVLPIEDIEKVIETTFSKICLSHECKQLSLSYSPAKKTLILLAGERGLEPRHLAFQG